MKPVWKKIVDVKQAVLSSHIIGVGFGKYSAALLGRKYRFHGYKYADGAIFTDKDEIERIADAIRENPKKEISYLFSTIRKLCSTYIDFCKKIAEVDFKEKSNKELAKIFLEFFDEASKIVNTLNLPSSIEAVVTEIIEKKLSLHPNLKGNPEKIFEAFYALTISTGESDVILEKKALLELAIRLNKGEDISKELENVYKKFTFTYFVFFLGKFKSIAEYNKEVKELAKKDPEKELNKIISHRKNELKKFEKTIKDLDIKSKLLEMINFAREAIYIRTYRLDRINEGIFIVYPLLKEIAKRIDLEVELVPMLLRDEIVNALENELKPNKADIIERKNGYGFIYFNKNIKFYFGKDFKKIKEKDEIVEADVVRGRTAFRGKAIGEVVVVKSVDDLHKVKKGMILVCKMTTPNYVKEMEKAKAIVAEIGGITTHVAILSRELKKPCIMGTGNATKVFHDGDMVEVDADKGVVKKIK